MSRKPKLNLKKILYLNSGYYTSILASKIPEYVDYVCNTETIDYNNFYNAKRQIIDHVLDEDICIIVAEGIGAYCSLFVSNESLQDGQNIISRILINPILVPSTDLNEIGKDENVINTYKTLENYASKQRYLDTRHTFCIFTKDNMFTEKYAHIFKNNMNIPTIIIDKIDDNFIQNELKQYIDTFALSKEIIVK